MRCLLKSSRRISSFRHGQRWSGCITFWQFRRSQLRNADSAIQFEMFLGASRAISFAVLVIALAREFIASADAIAVASDRRSLDGHQSHSAFLRTGDTTRAGIVSQVSDNPGLIEALIDAFIEAKMRGVNLPMRVRVVPGGRGRQSFRAARSRRYRDEREILPPRADRIACPHIF